MKVWPGEASRPSGPSAMRFAAWVTRSRRLCGNLGARATLHGQTASRWTVKRLASWTPRTLVRYRRLAPGSPSVSLAATLLPRGSAENGWPGIPRPCRLRLLAPLPVAKSALPQTPESTCLPNSVLPFRRFPSREAPRSVIHTVALIEECNRRRPGG